MVYAELPGGQHTFDLFGLDALRDSTAANVVFTLLIIAVMTTICVLGTELSAMVQRIMIFLQVGALLLFAVVALVICGSFYGQRRGAARRRS